MGWGDPEGMLWALGLLWERSGMRLGVSCPLGGGANGKGWGLSLRIRVGPWAEGGMEGLRIGKSGWMDR